MVSLFQQIFHILLLTFMLFYLACAIGYIALVLVWFILGAVSKFGAFHAREFLAPGIPTMTNLESDWAALQAIADDHDDEHPMHDMRRDGHCHEAVMWYVHHLTQDVKDLLGESGVVIPLLSTTHHSCPPDATDAHQTVCQAYQEQVTCASCHTDVSPNDAH